MNFMNDIKTQFSAEEVKEVLKRNFINKNTKITDEAAALISELLKMLVIEVSLRACKQAKDQDSNVVRLDHVESILLHTMLDFP